MKNKGKINVRGKFMKKINKLFAAVLVGVVGVLGIGVVHAADLNAGPVTVKCNNSKLAIGASTVCDVIITPSEDLADTATTVNKAFISMSQSEYITASSITANEAAGFKIENGADTSDKTVKERTVQLGFSGKLTKGVQTKIMSFTLKLEEAASKLPEGNCAELCVSGVMFDVTSAKGTIAKAVVGDTGKACPNIIITEQKCEGKGCNPETGEFINYAIIAGVAGISLVAIAVVTKKKKFYTV